MLTEPPMNPTKNRQKMIEVSCIIGQAGHEKGEHQSREVSVGQQEFFRTIFKTTIKRKYEESKLGKMEYCC